MAGRSVEYLVCSTRGEIIQPLSPLQYVAVFLLQRTVTYPPPSLSDEMMRYVAVCVCVLFNNVRCPNSRNEAEDVTSATKEPVSPSGPRGPNGPSPTPHKQRGYVATDLETV